MRGPSRGLTLLEVLVVLALFSLVSGMILAVFILTHRYSRLYQQVSQAHRETAKCMQGISRELARAHHDSFRPASMVNVTWCLSSKPLDGVNQALVEFDPVSGEMLWHKWIAIWCDGQGEVRLSELPLAGGTQTFLSVDLTTAPASLASFTTIPRQVLLGSSMSSLRIDRNERFVTVDLVSLTSSNGNPVTRYQLSSSFSTQ